MGLGNIGLAVASHVSKFYPVTGYDIRDAATINAMSKGLQASTRLEPADIYVIAVNTYFRNNAPDMSAVDLCCDKISKLNPNSLVCFESTLSVGTSRQMAKKYKLKYVAVCPHRWWRHDQVNHGVVQTRVLGALNPESKQKATRFYDSLQIPIHQVESTELAEASKLVENSDYYLRIVYAEELKLMCDKNGLDFNQLREAVNTKWNMDLPEAMNGIGGECLPKDIRFLQCLDPLNILLNAAVQLDECYRNNLNDLNVILVAQKVKKRLSGNG
jgi:UDP-N-acetyl-D-mannosaminuronic acid dehydrogenase